jgi:ariadne-1
MASASDIGGSNKRCRQVAAAAGFTNVDSAGESSGPSKRFAGGDEDDGRADLETADGGEDGSDGVYEYADSDGGEVESAAAGRSQPDADATARDADRRCVVLTEDVLRARQEADTARVAEVLSVPPGVAAALLRHFAWRVGRAQEEWFSDGARVRAAVGLPDGGAPSARAPGPRACGVCFDEFPAGATRAAACGAHFYCDACWRGYLGAAVGDGARCLSLRCPEPSCGAAVVRELAEDVLAVAGGEDAARYARFWLRSYVEESTGRVRWCPGPGCHRALELLGGGGGEGSVDVFCACRHGFCWRCGEEAHRPVSCATVRAWLAKNWSGAAETANWVVAHTKPCPKCGRPIEKNQGCNHMRCAPPCGHHFCWLCLQPAGGSNHYSCRNPPPAAATAEETDEQRAKRRASAALGRYLHHYERWAANRASLDAALRDMAALEAGGLERMARAADRPTSDLGFVADAYRQVADGRRVLRWAHAYGYYLDPERGHAKRGLFDDLEGQANRWLECLHGAVEVERKELFGGGDGVVGAAFAAYRQKVANLTRVTRRFLDNLVRAFETDLPEVVAASPPARLDVQPPRLPPPRRHRLLHYPRRSGGFARRQH